MEMMEMDRKKKYSHIGSFYQFIFHPSLHILQTRAPTILCFPHFVYASIFETSSSLLHFIIHFI